MQRDANGYWHTTIPEARAGHEYRFLLTTPAGELWRTDPYARQVTESRGNAVVCDTAFDWQGDDFHLPSWNELVLYEMHIGTFHVPPGQRKPGTFATASARLDHLARLGVNAIELMPIAEFEGGYSWGYNPAHPFAVEVAYGGPRAFKTFVQECHRRGIGVILDVVYNHLGPNALDLWCFDGWQRNGLGGIYFYNDDRARTPWGHTRPDYGRPEVRQFLRDNALMWLEEYHVDGLRVDSTSHIRTVNGLGTPDLPDGWRFMQELNRDIRQRFPGRLCIAEDLQNYHLLTKDANHGGAGFGSQWDPSFLHAVRTAVRSPTDEGRPMHVLKEALYRRYNSDAFQRVIYTESHDDVANGKQRLPRDIHRHNPGGWHAQKRATLAAVLTLTAPGIPLLFQGQEFLAPEGFSDKVPLNWKNAERQRGLVQLHGDLVALRLNRAGKTRGLCGQYINVHHVNDGAKVIAYHRWDRGGPRDDTVVLANFSHRSFHHYELGFPQGGQWRLRFNSDWRGYSSLFGNTHSTDCHAAHGPRDGMPYHGSVAIGPYSALVFSQGN
jgi:1,4-alpha-glucan branching enzyme